MHDWINTRGWWMTMIVFINHAARRVTVLRFALAEATRAYVETLCDHVLAHGVRRAFYSDRRAERPRIKARCDLAGDNHIAISMT